LVAPRRDPVTLRREKLLVVHGRARPVVYYAVGRPDHIVHRAPRGGCRIFPCQPFAAALTLRQRGLGHMVASGRSLLDPLVEDGERRGGCAGHLVGLVLNV